MALPDLSGSNIQDTYQRVLHTDGTIIYDGTGSVVLDATELLELQSLGSNNVNWTYLATINQSMGTADTSVAFTNLTVTGLNTIEGNAALKLPSNATGLNPHLQTAGEDTPGPSIFLGDAGDSIISFVSDGGDIVSRIGQLGEYSGNALTATTATNIEAVANAENELQYVAFLDNNNTTQQQVLYDGGLLYNPSSNELRISGDLTVTDIHATNITASAHISASGTVVGSNLNITNWDSAFGFGDHSSVGYLTDSDTINGGSF